MQEEVMVSICCIAYNHEKYIRQALDSFLSQEVDFKIEIVINDDASTDKTAEIIKEYEVKYPDIIKGIYQKENQYSQGVMVSKIVRQKAIGKYIAFCEGDDFWTDTKKLKEQVEFLEKNKSYLAIAHWCDVVDEEGKVYEGFKHSKKIFHNLKDEYTLEDYKKDIIPGHVNTILHRNIFKDAKYDYAKMYSSSKKVGDRTTYLILCLLGKIKIEHKVRSAYRYVITAGDSFSAKNAQRNICDEWFEYYTNLEKNTFEVFGKKISLKRLKYEQFLTALNRVRKNNDAQNQKVFNHIKSMANFKELIPYFPIAILNKIDKNRELKKEVNGDV